MANISSAPSTGHNLAGMINVDELVKLRHTIHAHPELSNDEYNTSKRLKKYLEKYAPDQIVDMAECAFAAVYEGAEPGPTVLIRSELDALPIHEVNDDLEYKSTCDGVSHKCGHDGHMSILAGLAQMYSMKRPDRGRVVLLYQQAEETGNGARDVLEDPAFKAISPDYAFALHNMPSFPEHSVACKPGIFTSAVKSMIIKLHGKTAHSAQPETGDNPGLAIAEIIEESQRLTESYKEKYDFAMIVPIYLEMGEKSYGVSAGYGEAHFTLRALNNEDMATIWNDLESAAKRISAKYNIKPEFDFVEEFAANHNDDDAVEMIQKACADNGLQYISLEEPFRWGEDFGLISSSFRGAMFALGAGEDRPDLHNPDYNFPDELIMTGISMFSHLIEQVISGEAEKQAA